MKTLDIILVSFNSEKWIENCLSSIEKVNYPLRNIYLTFVDNNSRDRSLDILQKYNKKALFGGFNVIALQDNVGFGPANNIGVKNTQQPYIFFLNIDTELEKDSISELIQAAETSDDDIGLWEARQFPYEHPKLYNPVTMETSWASAAACMVRRDYFSSIGMFDENIFMYAEDVDLSWRFRANGYKTVYVPKSIVYHYTYMSAGEVKPNQFYNSTYNNLMLRYKFGNLKDILNGYALFNSLFAIKGPSPDHKKVIRKNLFRSFVEGRKFRKWKKDNRNVTFKPDFKGWDYELIRDGAFYVNELAEERPLVSIIVRTCERPSVLRETLISLRNQTYKNIEVVVVEDGPDVSRKLIEEEFSDLQIVYKATMEKVGRCVAGNMALDLASGKYLNFLDDDDLFYADHVEVLCTSLAKNPQYKIAYSIAFETPIQILSKEPYQYKELFHNVQYREKFNRLVLLHHNYFPIQTVMFEKEVYKELGGFDLSLEVLEDWDLWLRYALKYDFLFVEKLTSIYRVPALPQVNHERQKLFDDYLNIVREKHFKHNIEVSAGEIFKDVEQILNRPQSVIYQVSNTSWKVIAHKIQKKLYTKIKQLLLSR
ncbi:glycosyltransferase family 2 protein [Ammoniphilus sp. 3BR4]|uniref:glycosyltransferase family 2 protein n=1 Tax=Ammoniphilus sp. 3BR4 TaxID=3158265 RepID=UPI003465D080